MIKPETSFSGYCICARWPKAVDSPFPNWEPWTARLTNIPVALQAHARLIAKGAGKRYEFGLFRSAKAKPLKLIRRLKNG